MGDCGLMSGRLWVDEWETVGCSVEDGGLMSGRLWVDERETVG